MKISAEELGLSEEQVRIGLEYIAAHRQEVEAEYGMILQRVQQENPEWIEAGRAPTPEELRARIRGRGRRTLTHAHPGR